jgi:hypothetical protein
MSDTTTPNDRRPCHDWHWIECDRVRSGNPCQREGREHVRMAGHGHPLWLCEEHAAEARASTDYLSGDNGHERPARR